MPIVDPFGKRVIARLLDFFASSTPWYRRLWCPSVLLALKEVIEASHAVRAGVLNESTMASAVQSATLLAVVDPGIGGKEAKRALQQALGKKNIVPDGADYWTVKIAAEAIEASYLQNWAESLAKGDHPDAERTARAIASHLLDAGFHPNYLHRWCKFQSQNAAGANSLSDLAANALAMVKQPQTEFSVLVAFDGVPPSKAGLPANYVPAQDVALWLTSRGFGLKGLIQNGALLFRISARDAWTAVQATVDTVDQLSSRVSLGADRKLQPVPTAWVEDDTRRTPPRSFPFRRDSRRIEVHALHREDKLYVLEATSIVDAALQLIGTLNSAPPSIAVGAGWAAIEALLSGPGDPDVVAGDRLATLVACSITRAELTGLSFKIEQSGHRLAPQLAACATNRDRAKIVSDAIAAAVPLNLTNASDMAAEARVQKLLANPYEVLRDIQNHISATLVRMYKNRNLVLHGGKVDAVSLQSNLMSASPLIGAGMDRIAHAWFVQKIGPLQLAARARYSLETVGAPAGPHVVDLLS